MSSNTNFQMSTGYPFPYGTTIIGEDINFALPTKSGTAVTLCLFDSSKVLLKEIVLDPKVNKTGSVWHILLHNVDKNYLYAYKVNGYNDPQNRNRFNPEILLLDPYAKTVATSSVWGNLEKYLPLGIINQPNSFDWEGVKKPEIPLKNLIIYELHVRGFTKHSSSKVNHSGTFLGIIEKIPYFLELGINALELMPIHEFNENEIIKLNPEDDTKLFNYWGYSTVNFFSPMNRYASKPENVVVEFKTMVRELHRNGIEVILDIVFNHTAEGNENGPIYSFKGIDNSTYYMIEDDGKYANYSGCGNTFNCNHPIARELIIDALRYYVTEMRIDGFRFDLASIFSRNSKGLPNSYGPLIEALTEDPIISNTKLIAEPWDAAGLYQVGGFVPDKLRWSEWNGKYRDSVRRFIKGDSGTKGEFATRLAGSQDLYAARSPLNSINFIISHDGFSLADLVSYNDKHNYENGEENRDGGNDNLSWNCGNEGATTSQKIINLRKKQVRNFHLALMVSQGIPMLVMGDEAVHTKKGNNNTWAQDNELNWFDWDNIAQHNGFFRFYKGLIKFRKENPILSQANFLTEKEIEWHGIEPSNPNWNASEQFLAFLLKDPADQHNIYVAFNAQDKAVNVHLPKLPKTEKWHMIVNTAAASPDDYFDNEFAPLLTTSSWRMPNHSAILLRSSIINK